MDIGKKSRKLTNRWFFVAEFIYPARLCYEKGQATTFFSFQTLFYGRDAPIYSLNSTTPYPNRVGVNSDRIWLLECESGWIFAQLGPNRETPLKLFP